MISSRRLFRRHRNRDVAGSQNPAPPSSPSASVAAEGGDSESPPAEGDVGSPERRDTDDSNDGDAATVCSASNDEQDDDEQELVVQIPNGHPAHSSADAPSPFLLPAAAAWEPTEEAVALRRESIRQEVERVQRANFIHFMVLCLVPTTLLLIVISAILSEDGECGGSDADGPVACEREPRSFVNAFTSRCICEAVSVMANEDLDGEGG